MQRSTRQRDAMLDALRHAGRPLSPDELLVIARKRVPTVNLATVYRNLKSFAEENVVALVQLPGEPPRYELASAAAHHHHHFVCEQCDRVFDVDGCASGLVSLVPDGFEMKSHEITLYGTCPDCAAA